MKQLFFCRGDMNLSLVTFFNYDLDMYYEIYPDAQN